LEDRNDPLKKSVLVLEKGQNSSRNSSQFKTNFIKQRIQSYLLAEDGGDDGLL
jgi:hypothetical protein